MRIFKPIGGEGFEIAQPIEDEDFETLKLLIDGTPRARTWVPVPMKIISNEMRRRALCRSDAPWLTSDNLILRAEAAEALMPFLGEYGEVLPLVSEQGGLVVYNPLHVVDALNEAMSIVLRFDDGRIMWVQKYAFRREVIQNLPVFKVMSLQPSPVFMSEEFVERWRAAGLKGLEFRQVWEG